MADEKLRTLERKAAQGDPSAVVALERERARVGICPACEETPACYLLEGEKPDDEGMRACQSALPPCEDCEGDKLDDLCDAANDGHLQDCHCESCSRCDGSGKDPFGIVIDGETFVFEVAHHLGYDADLWQLSSPGHGHEFIVAIDAETAGEGVIERWREMASDDPGEFTEMVGAPTLVAWALGQPAGPGTYQATSLEDWLTHACGAHPEEEWAGYDGVEREVTETGCELRAELGFVPAVAYRSN